MPKDKSLLHKIPKQKVSFDEKDEDWGKDTINAYIEMSFFSRTTNRPHDVKALYDYYQGYKHDDDYKYVLAPYGGKKRDHVPADLKRYNIIKPIVDVLVGEKSRRPSNLHIAAINPDSVDIKKEEETKVLQEALTDQFFAILQERLGVDAGQEEIQATVDEKVDFFRRNYKDIRSELGQQSFNYIKQYCEFYDKNQTLFKDFLVAGEEYVYNGVNNDEPEYRVINPLDVDYDKDPDLEFVEDGDWAVVRRLMSANSILDTFHSKLTPKQVDRLEDPKFHRESYLTFTDELFDDDEQEHDRLIEVMEVYWKSFKKVGFLSYVDEMTGELEEIIVDEEYTPGEDEEVEWMWVNEVWQGFRIDQDIFIDIKPFEAQRRSLDNPSKCKLPINGRKYSNRNSPNISLVMMGIPYQLMYDIYKYRLELSIAKSKDIIAEFDVSAIPSEWGIDKFMHLLEITGIAWMDYNQEGKKVNPHAKKALDLSVRTIDSYLALLDSIKLEWEQASGVPRQRQGNVDAYDGKGVNEQSIIQSSYITEDYFVKHERFERRNAQALIDNSKHAWLNGKKGSYVLQDGYQEFFSIDADEYAEAEFGVFATNTRKDIENLNTMKSLSQAFAQNGGEMSTIAEILESDNFAEIKRKIKYAEEIRAKQEAEIAQMNQEAAEADRAMEEAKMEAEEMRNIRDNETRIEQALIQADSKLAIEQMKQVTDGDKTSQAVELEREKLRETTRSNKVDETLKRLEIRVKDKAASKKSSN